MSAQTRCIGCECNRILVLHNLGNSFHAVDRSVQIGANHLVEVAYVDIRHWECGDIGNLPKRSAEIFSTACDRTYCCTVHEIVDPTIQYLQYPFHCCLNIGLINDVHLEAVALVRRVRCVLLALFDCLPCVLLLDVCNGNRSTTSFGECKDNFLANTASSLRVQSVRESFERRLYVHIPRQQELYH